MKSTLSLALAFAVAVTAVAALCPRADTEDKRRLVADAKAVLDGNWVADMNSTLPSPNLYPHQWSWDAAFVAMGYSHYDTGRAVDEMRALLRGQWRNGHIPHIVFNPSAVESYFPGPDFWKIDTAGERGPVDGVYTSGITQPAVHAVASLAIFQNAKDAASKVIAMDHLKDFYPKLCKWHDYLYRERDPRGRNLVFIRHMWESGMDNSPAWDPTLRRMHLTPEDIPAYKRVDKGKVGDHKERPDNFFYDRAVHLIKVAYDAGYDEAAIAERSPFLIEDVLFNSILARAGLALADIADILGLHDEAAEHRARSHRTSEAMNKHMYDEETGFFYDYDLVTDEPIKTRISGGLVGVYGAQMSPAQTAATIEHLLDPGFLGPELTSWTIPSVSRDDPGYTNTTYWKGPAWININFLVREGLRRNAGGNADALRIADFLQQKSLALMRKSGFYEYFNPISGSPHGGHQFSWSAALTIDWVCRPDGYESVSSTARSNTWLGLSAVAALLIAAVAFTARPSTSSTATYPDSTNTDGDNVSDEDETVTTSAAAKKQADQADILMPTAHTRLRSGSRVVRRRV